MGVGRDDHAVAVLQVLVAILDLVGVHMGHTHLHGHRQIDDHGALRGGLHDIQHGVAHLYGVVHLGAGKAFGAVLKQEIALVLLAELLYQLCAVHSDLLDLLLGLVEHLFPLRHGSGVVEVDHRPGCALDCLEGAADDVVAALGQHLHRDIGGDHILFDQGAQELVLGLTGGGEAHLDLLETDLHQHLEELQLFCKAHGHDQRLIAVPQIHAAPCGSLFNMVLFYPAVITGGYRVVPRCVLGSVHHPVVLLMLWCIKMHPFRLLVSLASTFPKGTAFQNAVKLAALPIGAPERADFPRSGGRCHRR